MHENLDWACIEPWKDSYLKFVKKELKELVVLLKLENEEENELENIWKKSDCIFEADPLSETSFKGKESWPFFKPREEHWTKCLEILLKKSNGNFFKKFLRSVLNLKIECDPELIDSARENQFEGFLSDELQGKVQRDVLRDLQNKLKASEEIDIISETGRFDLVIIYSAGENNPELNGIFIEVKINDESYLKTLTSVPCIEEHYKNKECEITNWDYYILLPKQKYEDLLSDTDESEERNQKFWEAAIKKKKKLARANEVKEAFQQYLGWLEKKKKVPEPIFWRSISKTLRKCLLYSQSKHEAESQSWQALAYLYISMIEQHPSILDFENFKKLKEFDPDENNRLDGLGALGNQKYYFKEFLEEVK